MHRPLGKGSKNQNGNLEWHLPLGVGTPPPPYWHKFPDISLPHFLAALAANYLHMGLSE